MHWALVDAVGEFWWGEGVPDRFNDMFSSAQAVALVMPHVRVVIAGGFRMQLDTERSLEDPAFLIRYWGIEPGDCRRVWAFPGAMIGIGKEVEDVLCAKQLLQEAQQNAKDRQH